MPRYVLKTHYSKVATDAVSIEVFKRERTATLLKSLNDDNGLESTLTKTSNPAWELYAIFQGLNTTATNIGYQMTLKDFDESSLFFIRLNSRYHAALRMIAKKLD